MVIDLKHYRILFMMLMAAILGALLDLITLCNFFSKSCLEMIWVDYRRYMATRQLIKNLDKLMRELKLGTIDAEAAKNIQKIIKMSGIK